MDKFDDHFNNYVKYINKIKKDKMYRLTKRLFYLTHTKGPHMDFYNNPLGFNGSNLEKKITKLRSKIIKAMICVIQCERRHVYVNKRIVEIIIEQLEMCIDNKGYWLRYGFNEYQVSRIQLNYQMLIIFYKEYLLRARKSNGIEGIGSTENRDKLYKYLLKLNTSLDLDPAELQIFAFRNLTSNVRKYGELMNINELRDITINIDNMHNSTFMNLMINERVTGTSINSEHELLAESKKILIEHHQNSKQLFDDTIKMPNITKVTVKAIPSLISKWSSKGRANKNTIYINTDKYSSYKKEILPRLLAHEGIPGHLLERSNQCKIIKDMDINKKIKPIVMRGIKMLKEGWAVHSESILLKDTMDNRRSLLLNRIYYDVRTIMDVGLNYSKGQRISMNAAFDFVKNFTGLTDDSITAEIHKCIGNPSTACSYMMGAIYIDNLVEAAFRNGLDTKTIYSRIITSPLNAQELYKFITNLK